MKLFVQTELDNLKIKSEYRPPKDNKKPNPLLNHAGRRETAAKGKAPLLQNQSDTRSRSNSAVPSKPNQSAIRPRSNSKPYPKQNENIKRYVVIDGKNVAIQ